MKKHTNDTQAKEDGQLNRAPMSRKLDNRGQNLRFYADINPKSTNVRCVRFSICNENGDKVDEKDVTEPDSTGNNDTYHVDLKAMEDIKAGYSLYVKVISSEYRSVTIPETGERIRRYKEYPLINSGLSFGDVIEAAKEQKMAFSSGSDYFNSFPMAGEIGRDMMADTGSITFSRVYLDPAHPETSPYADQFGISVSVKDTAEKAEKLEKIKNGKTKEAKLSVPDRVDQYDPHQQAKDSEKAALQASLQGKSQAEQDRITADWEKGQKEKYRKEQKKQQKKDALAKMDDKNSDWDLNVVVVLQLEYLYDRGANDYVFAGGQYLVSATPEISKLKH